MRYENYWLSTEPVEPGPPLPGDVSCDVAIVGGGYTGLWAAHFLKEESPGLDVHILEADYAGAGASGMNAGFVQMTAGKVLRRMLWYYGREKAGGVYKSVARSILELGRFCKRNEIDADFQSNGIVQVATDRKQLARIQLQVARANRAGAGAFDLLDAKRAQEIIGSPSVLGAIKVSGAQVNPHRLVRGLARVVRSQGVTIHEQTPVTTIVKNGDKWEITTEHGTVTASQVVVATNAWQGTFPELYARQYPIWNYLMVSEPLTDAQLAKVRWPGREAVANSLSFSTAARLTPDNRVLWAGGLWYRFGDRETSRAHERNDEAFGLLEESFRGFFPQWGDVKFAYAHGGLISWSHTFIPQFGRTPSGMIYGHGYTGSGIAASHTGGKILRDLVLERQTEYTDLAFVTVNQPKFLPGEWGNKGADYFIWRQRVGDKLPLMLPYRAALAPGSFFKRHSRSGR
ncbi:NAD(P)/FAD-dependent oxidoreductase [Catelliglobosispora koreensis]|uniref:NAD(P)/FAD-dependent oxidoreductase n=1 Tax=Catelliglobosispora koreensis TaxID=129052 RepID=UPI00036F273B|nr:FAD-binding oxidoreductase [Catelliglobosispora koreensis]